jgi:hypothetical protein
MRITNTATAIFFLIACAIVGVLWFLLDHHIITPVRIRKAEQRFLAEMRKMRHAAGCHPHLPRKMRRHRARLFAKKLSHLARVTGQTAGLSRHEVRGRHKRLAAMPRGKRKSADALTALHVSSTIHELVKDMESQAMAVESATYYAERDRAYDRLALTRTSLYRYVAELETRCSIPQTTTLRF